MPFALSQSWSPVWPVPRTAFVRGDANSFGCPGRPGLSFCDNRQYYPHTITDFASRYPIAFQAPFGW